MYLFIYHAASAVSTVCWNLDSQGPQPLHTLVYNAIGEPD